MSVNRENVVWQSKDKTWNIGFYDFSYVNQGSEDFDPEWDVNYDYSSFMWAATGFLTKDAAIASWKQANPGSHDVLPYSDQTATEIAQYDLMAWAYANPDEAAALAAQEEKKRVRAIRKETKAVLEDLRAGATVSVSFVDAPYASIMGPLKKDGEWLVINSGHKVYRVIKADKSALHPNILSGKHIVSRSRSYHW